MNDREDSGVIDLFAIHNRASAAPPSAPNGVPPDAFSAPPPAFTTDLGLGLGAASAPELGDLGDDDANPFQTKPRKKLYMMAGAGGALVFVGILIACLSGGSPEPTRAAATTVDTPPPPPAATIAPPPVVIAPVAPTPPPAAANVPAPPATGAPASVARAPSRAGGGKSRATTSGGVKLTKIQSGGVPSK